MTPAAGVGLKAVHFTEALAAPAADLWFEVHAENYMVAGGARLAMLEAIRRERPISLHGVGMSLAGAADPEPDHLVALKRLVDRFEPVLVSEHLAWSRLDGRCFPDLLPVPRTNEVLSRLAANIGRVQDTLGREILIENPTHYLALRDHQWSETSFLAELARRSGCRLLIDINNVAVGAHNLAFDAAEWLEAIPAKLVGEIHLAGHMLDAEGTLLIDSHDAPVSHDVWQLYESFIARSGPMPTLIERDGNLPPFADLMAERDRAQAVIRGVLDVAA
jgi:uncharacterized protein (UPF0276 family)